SELKAAEKALDKKMEPIRAELRNWQKKVDEGVADVKNWQRQIDEVQRKINAKGKHEIIDKSALETYKAGLIVSKEGAELALKGLRESLKFVEKKIIQPKNDPRIIAAKGGLAAAEGGLWTAEKALEGLIKTLGFTGQVGSFIIEKGLPKAFNMTAAGFSGGLGSVSDGKVQLKTDLVFLGKKQKIDLNFDFNDPFAAVKNLADQLLGN
ncbi:MAG: hypothetical protein AAFV80_15405, partial [Bacteroidota bacterium]